MKLLTTEQARAKFVKDTGIKITYRTFLRWLTDRGYTQRRIYGKIVITPGELRQFTRELGRISKGDK